MFSIHFPYYEVFPSQLSVNCFALNLAVQIQRLLDAMNLSQYKESFQREQVTGVVLLECDEDILENELNISSRIHRIRLIKIISGEVSANDTLNNTPYVVFTH